MFGSCSATGSPGLIPTAARDAATRSEAASSCPYVSWPCADSAAGLSGEECALSRRMTARLKLMAPLFVPEEAVRKLVLDRAGATTPSCPADLAFPAMAGHPEPPVWRCSACSAACRDHPVRPAAMRPGAVRARPASAGSLRRNHRGRPVRERV